MSARSPRLQAGLSLVELMVAIVLGLLVTDALVAMFVGVRSAGRMTSGVAALSDSGRFALDTVEQTVRGAGNIACNSTAPVTVANTSVIRLTSLLQPSGGSLLLPDYGDPVVGYEGKFNNAVTGPGSTVTIAAAPVADNAAADWVTTDALGDTLDATLTAPPVPQGDPVGSGIGAPIEGSDMLVVHETLAGMPPSYTTAVAMGAGAFNITSASAFTGANQIGAITNCVQTEVFQLGGFAPGAGVGVVTLGGNNPGNTSGTLPLNIDFGIGAQVVALDTTVFYIGIGEDGDGALFRWDTNGGVLGDPVYGVNSELVPDVENMQILYGVEDATSSTTQTVAQYVTADQVHNAGTGTCQIAVNAQLEDFNCVISVKVALLVASPRGAVQKGAGLAASPPALLGTNWSLATPDNRMRQVYEQTMFLRNMSP